MDDSPDYDEYDLVYEDDYEDEDKDEEMEVELNYVIESYHGGHCCGMTCVHTFPNMPSKLLPERKKLTDVELAKKWKEDPHSVRHMNYPYPEQTAEARLRDMVDHIQNGQYTDDKRDDPESWRYIIRSGRARGIIEVVMIDVQLSRWKEILLDLGFQEVSKSKNSNSNNTIHVFHLVNQNDRRAPHFEDTETKPDIPF